MVKKWTKEEIIRVVELLTEHGSTILSHPDVRNHLTRDQNLLTNQLIRQANGNIAYRSVDVDINNLSDDEFWEYIDHTPYHDLIEDNAAAAIIKMVEKLGLTDE